MYSSKRDPAVSGTGIAPHTCARIVGSCTIGVRWSTCRAQYMQVGVSLRSVAPVEPYGTNESGESTNRRVAGFPHGAVAVDTFLADHYC
jgi:hypothetical protein